MLSRDTLRQWSYSSTLSSSSSSSSSLHPFFHSAPRRYSDPYSMLSARFLFIWIVFFCCVCYCCCCTMFNVICLLCWKLYTWSSTSSCKKHWDVHLLLHIATLKQKGEEKKMCTRNIGPIAMWMDAAFHKHNKQMALSARPILIHFFFYTTAWSWSSYFGE